MKCGVLYNLFEITKMADDSSISSDWRNQAFNQFCDILSCVNFPCLFGRKAYKLSQCKILFIDDQEEGSDKHLIQGFLSYADFVLTTDMEDRLLYPMIVFLRQKASSLQAEHRYAWQLLQTLHDNDPIGWPKTLESDPEKFEWSFCFGGVPIFVNISAPSHHLMKSRNLGDYIVLVVNPRANFDRVASVKNISGRKIREKIRKRVFDYNNGFMPDSLGYFGELANLEWKQYQLNEPGAFVSSKCPINIIKK